MGRAIMGDIEGKCWFGVQDSNFADRFGSKGYYLEINYNFDSAELPILEKELAKIEKTLGDKLVKLNKFFDEHSCYTDKELAEYLKSPKMTFMMFCMSMRIT